MIIQRAAGALPTKPAKSALARIILVSYLLLAPSAHAGEWFGEAVLFADATPDSHDIYCHRSHGHASHMGARLEVYTGGRHTVRAVYVHNSCIEEYYDKRTRDVLGIGYELRLW